MADWSQYIVQPPAGAASAPPATTGDNKWAQYVVSTPKAAAPPPAKPDTYTQAYDADGNPILGMSTVDSGPTKSDGTFSAPESAAIGGGMGMTAGLATYPFAGAAYAAGNLGKTPMTWKQALAATRATLADAQEQNPGSYTGGQIAGSVLGAGKLSGLGRAAGLGTGASLVAAGTAQGAANGFSANNASDGTTLQDTATGAGLGALSGVVGAGANKAINVAAGNKIAKAVADKLGIDPSELSDAVRSRIAQIFTKGSSDDMAQIVKNIQASEPTMLQNVWNSVKTIPGEAATGAIGGATAAGLTGNDPVAGAKWGAAGVVAASKLRAATSVQQGVLNAAMRNPGTGTTLTNGMNGVVGVAAANQTNQPGAGDRLRALADLFKTDGGVKLSPGAQARYDAAVAAGQIKEGPIRYGDQ